MQVTDADVERELLPCPVPWCEKTNCPELMKCGGVVCPDCGIEAESPIAWNTRPALTPQPIDPIVGRAREGMIAQLRAERDAARQALADIANQINIVGSHYDQAQKALDGIVTDVKSRAREVLSIIRTPKGD